MKKNKKQIIIASIAIGLILIIGISTLVLALIPTGMNERFDRPDTIYLSSRLTTKYPTDNYLILRSRDSRENDEISNIYSLFSHAFEQKLLNAIFNGELHGTVEENYIQYGSKSISKNLDNTDKITIMFYYAHEKTFLYKGLVQKYNYLVFEIDDIGERTNICFAIADDNMELSNNKVSYNYYYTAKANFKKLFEYVKNLIEE